jgi:hypothetical protein
MRRAIVCATALWFAGCGGSESNGMQTGGTAQPPASVSGPTAPPPSDGTTGTAGAAAPTGPGPTGEAGPASTDHTSMDGSGMQAAPMGMDQGGATPPTMEAPPGIPPPAGFKPNAMDECGLDTGWDGDEYCILPPPPDQGFQIHFGPSNYTNPEPTYVLQPGQEWVHNFAVTAPIDHDVKFYIRQYRMRPGAHHTIVRDTATGRRLSGSDVNQDHPVNGIVAPENAGVGIPLAAHARITTDHHAINVTDHPLLQEVWVNFWYVDPAKVTETTTLLYDPGSISDIIQPHQDVVMGPWGCDMGPWGCDIQGEGRLLNMFGHVHANDVRFSAWRVRGGMRELIYESYAWEHPLWLEFTSLVQNTPPDPMNKLDGGYSGILDLQAGDSLEWECHEVNQQDTPLRFTNETYNGWMCIIIGELVGTSCKSRNPALMGFMPTE